MLLLTAALLFLLGTVSRLAPLADQDGRLLWQFPTEDGYLMLTIARDIAIGKGITVSDGTVMTNGTQPLATLLWSTVFVAVDGDKYSGVLGVMVWSACIALAAAMLLYRLANAILPVSRAAALFVAGAWYALPTTVQHTMNGLESGLYLVCVLGVVLLYPWWLRAATRIARIRRSMLMGLVLGVTFWARNDAVFLVAAVCGLRLWHGRSLRQDAIDSLVAGFACLATAMPWLSYNWIYFDHIVPVSGRAEQLGAHLGQNLHLLPVALAKYVVPDPVGLWGHGAPIVDMLLAGSILLTVCGVAIRMWPAMVPEAREMLALSALFGVALCIFYGALFGAPWFISRFLFPSSPLLLVLGAGPLCLVCLSSGNRALLCAGALLPIALLLCWTRGNVWLYQNGCSHMHRQIVHWVAENVGPGQWVGAFQTGTLGYFHDRTINLDGKVNPAALEARQSGTSEAFVAASNVEYFVDWYGFASWQSHPVFGTHFRLVHADEDLNIAAFSRREAVPRAGAGTAEHRPTGSLE